ncbi:MAG: alkaline phosphatase PhoX, partial [Bacteroidota bacterium]
ALGRCAHECATVVELEDGRIVVYTGDDANDQCLYKFIGSEPGSLSKGTLYVANTLLGKWIPIDFEQQKALQAKFTNQTDVLIRLREAAKLVGGTPLDRPEDIEIHPVEKGWVLVTLTNNTPKKNFTGSILKIQEADGRHDSLTFQADTYLTGGKQTGFASPDNMAFDFGGNLWFTSDMSGSLMNQHEAYLPFKNNGLFVVPREGAQAGKVVQVASAPVDAEFTGPWFAPDGETLFLSVQHPGEYSKSLKELRSHWPNGGKSIPRPAVIAISGEMISALNGGG